MFEIKIYNTLEKKIEKFVPIDNGHIRIYACGPTVYNYAHIGNARMAVANDLLINVLRTQYNKVTYVSNITDIDDKIIDAAQELNEPINNLTTKYTKITKLILKYNKHTYQKHIYQKIVKPLVKPLSNPPAVKPLKSHQTPR